jgi:hypothetical protein
MTGRLRSTPPELEAAMRTALNEQADPGPNDLLEAAERLLDKVLTSNCEARPSALDLLTVDALVTRALEESAKDPASVAKFADDAMTHLASHNRA